MPGTSACPARGLAQSIRAAARRWDRSRPTEGGYGAFLTFSGGAAATLTHSGYGHFDSDGFCDWIAESGLRKSPDRQVALASVSAR
ncbi:MAG TPA: hypothetical protein VN802_06660 [Stellaceae bacterium]|nr:hypothetical protein [Stellaceae bacterium]